MILCLAVMIAVGLLLLWPLNEPGVTGSPLSPHYQEFGWATFASLPEHPTLDALRDAGVPVPQDAVHRRKVEAAATAAVGAAGVSFLVGRRRRRAT